MLEPRACAKYVGFTEEEVRELCVLHAMDFTRMKKWYGGYHVGTCHSIYNPYSVMQAIARGKTKPYWKMTSAPDSLMTFIDMNQEGLQEDIVRLIAGERILVDTDTFQNDLETFTSKDDVLTYMIHLGYLGYNQKTKTAFVPNEEIRQELANAIESRKWDEMAAFQRDSNKLLNATLDMDGASVAMQIEKIHNEYASVIQYHNENPLSSILSIAYLGAMQYYFKPIREFPTGRGFADFVFIPKPEYGLSYPAMVIELKWNKSAETALRQIKAKKYPDSIRDYTGSILLVGINYDEKTKVHTCKIETVTK